MQYPVPQFTEVEDKIIGPLTIKQFGILFGTGAFIFVVYTISNKNLPVTIFFIILFGLPALGVAFAKFNGRALYQVFPLVVKFFFSSKVLIFHKETAHFSSEAKLKDAETKSKEISGAVPAPLETSQEKMKKMSSLLQKESRQEQEFIGKR